jgi:hypothetical protein
MYCWLSTCLCVKQVSGPRSVFRLPESGGNDATEELESALAKYKNTSKQIHNIVNGTFLNKGLSLSQRYRIVETVKKRQKFGGNERSEKQEPNQNLEDSGGQSSWPQTISEPCSILLTV